MNNYEAAKAIGHPIRVAMLEKMKRENWSPKQLSDELEMPIGNVSYHMRLLNDLGAVKLVDTAQRRGATEHFYQATHKIGIQVKEY